MLRRILVAGAALIPLTAPAARAQGPAFQTPGASRTSARTFATGQTSVFTNEFNPAFGMVLDTLLDYTDSPESDASGFDFSLRTFELSAAAYVDPRAWAYANLVATPDEVALEEGAIEYIGLPGNHTLRAGRFFVDFGKQMQLHVHDLRTIDRPLPLRTYLGDELAGDGLQYDNWFTLGDETAVRYSVGGFFSLLRVDEGADPTLEPVLDEQARKRFDELGFTARITGFRDAGQNGQIQFGTSARVVPDYSAEFEPSGDRATGLSNTVFGVDLTYGHVDDTATRTWTVGGEALVSTGDVGAEVVDVGVPGDPTDDVVAVVEGPAVGFYAFVDYGWNPFDNVGLQLAASEQPVGGLPYAGDVEVYWTHHFSDFHRIRLAVTYFDVERGDYGVRAAVQYTVFLGPHAHGANW